MLDCRLLPRIVFAEAFLFGYEMRGVDGARQQGVGACERAGEGTLVLAEVTALPHSAQTALVRTLTTRRMRAVGAVHETPFGASVIATTTCAPGELADLITRGAFDRRLASLLGEPKRLAPVREREGEVAQALPHGLPARFRARLEKLAWCTNYYGLTGLTATMTEEDVLERELIDAVEAAPREEAPRVVFADFCEERRRSARADEVHAALRAEEAVEQRPPRRVVKPKPVPNEVDTQHGYIERISTMPSRLARLEHLFRLAPALTELELVSEPNQAPDDWAHLLLRRHAKRLRTLKIEAPAEQHAAIRAAAPPGVALELV